MRAGDGRAGGLDRAALRSTGADRSDDDRPTASEPSRPLDRWSSRGRPSSANPSGRTEAPAPTQRAGRRADADPSARRALAAPSTGAAPSASAGPAASVVVPAAADPVAIPSAVVPERGSTSSIAAAEAAATAPAPPTRRSGARARRDRPQSTSPGAAPSKTGPVARRNGPARVAATVLLVPALIGTVALPAYAFLPGGHLPGGTPTKFSLSIAEAQGLEVSEHASGAPVSSDSFSVTTKEEIDAAAAEAERAAWEAELASRGTGEYAIVTQQAEGDDYPWWYETPDDYGGGLSPLRYYYRECVDFVAWRLNRDAGVTGAPWKWDWGNLASGSAWMWADAWQSKGWPTSGEPVVGAVAWFPYNHVAYVQSVNGDGTVTIEEYNWNSDHSYHVRTIPVGEALYLYPPA
ncbi:CHAP domain-containing protein [Agromyces tropicus]|uniref:CHAP domain-containing protein n=1 Tax=Agromyces tropicus TaxID=555371 RepID=UPI0031D3298C